MAGYIQSGQSEAIKLQNVANRRIIKTNDILIGRRGAYLIDDTTDYTGIAREAIIVREDTVFAVLEGTNSKGETIDLLTAYNLTGKTLFAGEFIPATEYFITRIQLTSGSIMTY